MKKRVFAGLSVLALLIVVAVLGYKYKGSLKIETAEPPDEVVRRFYGYIREGGSSSLSAAYKLISTKHFTLSEDKFKGVVLNYPSNMKVRVVESRILKDRAVITIEYKTPSAFGGDFTGTTEINLDLDKETNSWKIDFTGETVAGEGAA